MGALIAITREVSPAIIRCELSYQERVEINYLLACEQHNQYQVALGQLGCQVIRLPAEPELPDSVFVEDVALVLDEVAIITNPGALSRQPEIAVIQPVLEQYRRLEKITAPGTLEGGDILRVGKTIYVGLSRRTNSAGIEQLQNIVAPAGYTVKVIEVHGCLHLKSAVTQVSPDTLLVNPTWVNPENFNGFQLVNVVPDEPQAANCLMLDTGIVYPASFPHTLERILKLTAAVLTVDVSELQKAEGAVTCCSLIFKSPGVVT